MVNDQDSAFDYDVFISHASEDKDSFVRALAQDLEQVGLRVWYDEWSLVVGDRLRRQIDEGLKRSRFGVVVLSPRFFAKNWPQQELDGLTALEMDGINRILPVWLDLGRDEVVQYSPPLADRVAASAARGIPEVVSDIKKAVDRTPRSAPASQPIKRATRRRIVDARLRGRNLVGDEGEGFAQNEDSVQLANKERLTSTDSANAFVILSVVPVGPEEEIDSVRLWEWTKSHAQVPNHPLTGTDKRPRGDGVIVRTQQSGEALSRYTYVSGDGYVEWGRALGGSYEIRDSQETGRVVRLGPLLWAAGHLIEFLSDLKAQFDLRGDYELVVSIPRAKGTVLTHLGRRWTEPWDGFRDYAPTTLDAFVQYRRALPAVIGEESRRAILLELDSYLNGVWGAHQPRGHDHPSDGGQLNDRYRDSDPWE